MKTRYSLTWKEHRQSDRWRWRQMPRRDLVIPLGAFTLVIILYVLCLANEYHRDPNFALAALRIDCLLMVALSPIGFLLGWLMEGYRRTVEIGPEGVVYRRYMEPLRLQWKSISVLDEDDQAIYIVFRQRLFWLSPTESTYVFIPKRAFPTPGGAETFYNQAQQYCKQAGGHPVASVHGGPALPQAQ